MMKYAGGGGKKRRLLFRSKKNIFALIIKHSAIMKKFAVLLLVLFFACWIASAQDIIIKKNGEDIKATVTEVNPTNVRYKKFDNPDGPLYTIERSDIAVIRYANGENEVYNDAPSARTVQQPGGRELSYTELTNIYDYRDYIPGVGDRYNVGWIAAASALVPGLGQAICGEWGHAPVFFFSHSALVGAGSFFATQWVHSDIMSEELASTVTIVCFATAAGLYAWNIIDALRVSKVKNMYYQDLNKQYSLDVRMFPSVQYIPGTFAPSVTLALAF